MGPFKMSDLSGLDVFEKVGNIMYSAYPNRSYKGSLVSLLVNQKRLGQKTGQGFYRYQKRKPIKVWSLPSSRLPSKIISDKFAFS